MKKSRVPDEEIEYDGNLVYTYKGVRFTGIGYQQTSHGLSEIAYVDGAQEGWARDWSPAGVLRGETLYRENAHHGWDRDFDEAENLVQGRLYEYGILTRCWSRRRRIDRRAVSDQRDGPDVQPVAKYRSERSWPHEK